MLASIVGDAVPPRKHFAVKEPELEEPLCNPGMRVGWRKDLRSNLKSTVASAVKRRNVGFPVPTAHINSEGFSAQTALINTEGFP